MRLCPDAYFVYREITQQDALGNITEAWLNDKDLQGNYLYDHVTGQMLFSRAGTVHDVSYYNGEVEGYDSYGNLMAQEMRDSSGQVRTRETFSYDKLHRLIKSDLNYDIGNNGSEAEILYGYDAVGNILKKTDYSVDANDAYQYHNGTNQINSIRLKDSGGTVYFGYDGRGNQISRGSSAGSLTNEVTYNAFNKPTHITKNSQDITLSYGADIMRFKQVRREENKDITTWYIGKHFEVEVNELTNVTTNRHFISDVAIVNIYNNQVPQILFTHRDRLGSAITLTDENNNADVRRFFDPFGKPRVGDNWSLWETLGFSPRLMNLPDHEKASYKGFTDHEHLDEAELIHMNGRVYDYNVGRFLSVDPLVHTPGGSQGINPYSYILNNPLSGTDPTGYEPEQEEDTKTVQTGSRIARSEDASPAGLRVNTNKIVSNNRAKNKAKMLGMASAMHAAATATVNGLDVSTAGADGTTVSSPTGIQSEAQKSTSKPNVGIGPSIARSFKGGGWLPLIFLPVNQTHHADGTPAGEQPLSWHLEALAADDKANSEFLAMIAAARAKGEDSIQIFRTASPVEANDIRTTRVFRMGPQMFPKQFTLTLQDAMDFQASLPLDLGQFGNPDYALPHTVFTARISLDAAMLMTPTIISDHGRQSMVLSAYDPRTLGRVNTSVLNHGGIQELGTK